MCDPDDEGVGWTGRDTEKVSCEKEEKKINFL